jgi:hypothetical protein
LTNINIKYAYSAIFKVDEFMYTKHNFQNGVEGRHAYSP